MKNTGIGNKKKRAIIYELSYRVLFILLLITGNYYAYSSDVRIGKTSMKISQSGTIVLKNDLSVVTDALIWNDGAVYLTNEHETTLDINTILDGDGIYYIYGNSDCTVKGEGAAISSLDVESGNTVYITDDLSVSGVLTLGDGYVNVAEGKSLKILDTSSEAIVYNDSYDNTSFIIGNLVRNTVSGNEYPFPLGTVSSGFHPFKAVGVSSSGYLAVSYLPDYADTWNAGDNNGVLLEDIGGWQVSTASEGITLSPALSLYSDNSILDGSYNILYTDGVDDLSPDFSLDYNSQIDEGTYLTSEIAYPAGLFAVSKVEFVDGDEEEVPELVNFLVQDGTGRTTFEVPGIEEYKEIILSVYNRFGNLVYESSNYANDFDSRDYRPGTYYYELTLVTKDERRVLCRNIIEILVHN